MLPSYDHRTGANKSPMPSCHCPPKELCPKKQAEWDSPPLMPLYIARTCCAPPTPEVCDVQYILRGSFSCPTVVKTGFEAANVCTAYKANAILLPEGREPSRADEERQGLRKAVATELNACLSNGLRPYLSYFNAPVDMLKSGLTGSRDMFAALMNAEYQCKVAAAQKLGIPASNISRQWLDALKDQSTGDMGLGWLTHHNSLPASIPARLHDVMLFTIAYKAMPYAHWINESTVVPAENAIKEKFPRPKSPLTSEFGDNLQCTDWMSKNLCFGAEFQNVACGDCFPQGILVTMGDGELKPIEEILPGDVVRGRTRNNIVRDILPTSWPKLRLVRLNDGLITMTADHPLMTTQGWKAPNYDEAAIGKYGDVKVDELKVGDVLITDKGEVPVTAIEWLEEQENVKTWNLRLDGDDTYFANGIIAKDY